MPSSSQVIGLALPMRGPRELSRDLGSVQSQALLAEADRLGVRPAVARNLQASDSMQRSVAARNLWLRQKQCKLVGALSRAGIRAHVVKGVALAERLYPDLSWRETSDVDVLVNKEDAPRAFEVLQLVGLVPRDAWNAAGLARQFQRSTILAPELTLTTSEGVPVELHWDWPDNALPEDDLFCHPEAYLVYLCRHAGKHFWSRLKWCCDIALFRQQFDEKLCWDSFWRLARETGAEMHCAISLELCVRWFGGRTAPGLDRRLHARARRLANLAATEILNPGAVRSHPVWTQFRLARWRDRPALARELLSPQPQEWNRAGGETRGKVWIERARHLWRRWAPHRYPKLSVRDWALLIEAYLVVAALEATRRMLPARLMLRAAHREIVPTGDWPNCTLEELQRVAWLVDVAANRQLVTVRCLTRSVALAWMLRRRGVDAELRVGVKNGSGKVEGHAWVDWRGDLLWEPPAQQGDYAVLPSTLVSE